MPARGLSRSLIAAAAAAAVLGACTGGSEPDSDRPAQPEAGGHIGVAVPGPIGIDPVGANAASPVDLMLLDLLHDGLTRVGSDGDIRPEVAESWRHDGTATRWTFTIDPDATFSSGRVIEAADVVGSLERLARAGDTSLAALRLEAITGFRDLVDGRADRLSGVSADDSRTVSISLDHPLSTLPAILASPELGVVSSSAVESAPGEDFDPDGLELSGRWSPTAWSADELVLERRDGLGHLDGVVIQSFSDEIAAYEALEAGSVDVASVPPARLPEALETYGDDHFAPFHAELLVGLRTSTPALASLELRQAIVAAIDREAIVELVYPLQAIALPSVVPDGVPGYEAETCDCGPDPDRARALLAQAFPTGEVPTVNLDFEESPSQQAMARMVSRQLEGVGIPTIMRLRPLEEHRRFVVSGLQEVFTFGWIGGYASPDAYLAPLFSSASPDNLTGVADAGVDTALGEAREPGPGAEARWRQVEASMLGNGVVIPIAQFRSQLAVADRVEAFTQAVDGSVDWSSVWLSGGG